MSEGQHQEQGATGVLPADRGAGIVHREQRLPRGAAREPQPRPIRIRDDVHSGQARVARPVRLQRGGAERRANRRVEAHRIAADDFDELASRARGGAGPLIPERGQEPALRVSVLPEQKRDAGGEEPGLGPPDPCPHVAVSGHRQQHGAAGARAESAPVGSEIEPCRPGLVDRREPRLPGLGLCFEDPMEGRVEREPNEDLLSAVSRARHHVSGRRRLASHVTGLAIAQGGQQ